MNEPELEINLSEIQAALYKVVREKVYQKTKDVPNWQLALESIYSTICCEIENWQETKEILAEDKLTLNALETEGYIRGLLYCKKCIEETLENYVLEIRN
jgi:hypothetical protein